jgi:hypothetical protein
MSWVDYDVDRRESEDLPEYAAWIVWGVLLVIAATVGSVLVWLARSGQ